MDIKQFVTDKAATAKAASRKLANISTEIKNNALVKMAAGLEKEAARLISENRKDLMEAEKKGVPTLTTFFGQKTAVQLKQQGDQADLIVANNVLAHVPDLRDFVGGLKILLKESGFELLDKEDLTANMETVAKRWVEARSKRREALVKIEGEKEFEGLQKFLEVTHTLSRERRLSRFVYLSKRV